MSKILITGATGNVGLAVLESLQSQPYPGPVLAGVRDVTKDAPTVQRYGAEPIRLDFEDASTFAPALNGVERVFLLRPPQLADVERYFRPFVAAAQAAGVRHVVFLSVQGADKSRLIPHHKMEHLLRESGLAYTFLRPAYFMQNFITTLRADVVQRHRVFLPAGRARFTLVDVRDVGRVAAEVLHQPAPHRNQAYDLTSADCLTFGGMTAVLSRVLGRSIDYVSPNPLRFFLDKKREGVPAGFVLVMIMLHYLPRFQATPPNTDWVQRITGRPPVAFEQFVQEHQQQLR